MQNAMLLNYYVYVLTYSDDPIFEYVKQTYIFTMVYIMYKIPDKVSYNNLIETFNQITINENNITFKQMIYGKLDFSIVNDDP